MNVVAVLQARMGSTRLPGKVLMDLAGRPMLSQLLHRLKRARRVDDIVIATTTDPRDDALVELAKREDVRWFRGSEQDVLSRIRGAAEDAGADAVVRLTGDCPLMDPAVVDAVVAALVDHSEPVDYASNVLRRTYPKGLDAEALFMDTLRRIDRMGTSPAAREHVTWFAYRERPDLFVLRSVEQEQDYSALNWSVDTIEDLEHARALYQQLGLHQQPRDWLSVAAQDAAR